MHITNSHAYIGHKWQTAGWKITMNGDESIFFLFTSFFVSKVNCFETFSYALSSTSLKLWLLLSFPLLAIHHHHHLSPKESEGEISHPISIQWTFCWLARVPSPLLLPLLLLLLLLLFSSVVVNINVVASNYFGIVFVTSNCRSECLLRVHKSWCGARATPFIHHRKFKLNSLHAADIRASWLIYTNTYSLFNRIMMMFLGVFLIFIFGNENDISGDG